MVVDENIYAIADTRPRYKGFSGKSENPIQDKEFIASLDDTIDDAMAFCCGLRQDSL
jgi:hypothetical protein